MMYRVPYPEISKKTKEHVGQAIEKGFKSLKEGDREAAQRYYEHANKVLSHYLQRLLAEGWKGYIADTYLYLCDGLPQLEMALKRQK